LKSFPDYFDAVKIEKDWIITVTNKKSLVNTYKAFSGFGDLAGTYFYTDS